MIKPERRSFVKKTAAASAIMIIHPVSNVSGKNIEYPKEKCLALTADHGFDLLNH